MERWTQIGWMVVAGIAAGAVLMAALWSRRPLRSLFSSAVQGYLGLGIVHILGGFFPVSLGFSWLTVGACGVLGLPGVVMLLLLNVIFPPLQ